MNSSRHHLAEVIAQKTLRIKDFHQLAAQIAAYLLETASTSQLESLIRDIVAYRAEHGVVEASTTSAHPLSKEDIADIKMVLKKEYPHAKQLNINQNIESELVGGVKLGLPGEQLDLTVKAKVNEFKRLTMHGSGV